MKEYQEMFLENKNDQIDLNSDKNERVSLVS
jgi:hypothetical protein